MARRISVPITLTTALVVVTLALTVGWQILVAREFRALVDGFTAVHWLVLTLGSAFFVGIITVTILQSVWLVREMRTNQRQRNFIDAVTHELHTPLASLRLYLDTLRSKELTEEQRGEFLGIMTEDLERLQRTIDQILRAARSEIRRSATWVDLLALLRECAAEARERHGLEAGAIALLLPPRAWVRGDLEQLRVAFRNLIENAIRYAGSKVGVEIRVRPVSSRKLEIEVADEGLGIPPSALRTVFQGFQRLTHEGMRATRGLGLGLYIVRNIVRSHGGTIRAESEGAGRGSRFIVTLPGQLDGSPHPAG
ncbi:MAG: sensor histidine kinase [Myxococcota bacterium]